MASFDKGDEVLIILNADPDAVASALAVKKLLRYQVKSVTIAYPNEMRRLSNIAMLNLLKIKTEKLQNVKVANYSKKVMLDSQPTHLRPSRGLNSTRSSTTTRPARDGRRPTSISARITGPPPR